MRRATVRWFRDLGYRAIEADGPREVLALLARELVDPLSTDVVMPGPMDGLASADEVLQRLPSIKLLLTSGFPGVTAADRLAVRGVTVRMLDKPYRKIEPARAVQKALRG